MNRYLPFLAAAALMSAAAPADAFWVARGWRGGVAVGGVRPPLVARDVYYPRCWRCAPVYPTGAVIGAAAAGAAVGGLAAAASTVAAPPAPPPASTASPAATPAASAATLAQASPPNAAASKCAEGLPSDSKMIYDASVRSMKGLDTLRDTVTEQTRSLVMAGKISQSNARPAAEKAGTCLRLLAQ
ncbi:hypothetical protein [Microvirga pudoricolor]|uniref:hypothetical protein n=1 Tax=Microvirga pudoricolor TaxID=2778729 RepID=UPI00194FD40A|nr:hypothetical protein [Microvirga pudoricolor]MBM6595469.1 hypothetical protein [Microvirga pudoricolor]